MKSKNKSLKEQNKKNILKEEDLKNLDEYIQKCLDIFKFVEPKKELYEAAGEDKDIIISHKSTIPDLVIWNKTFNKNKCFIGANTSNPNDFPRFLFYIKIKKNKKTKNMNNHSKNSNKKNKSDNNDFNIDFFGNNNNMCQVPHLKKENNNNNNSNIIENNENNININQNLKYKINEEKNKFSILQNQNINNTNMINLAIYLIKIYLNKNGWIILTNEQFSGPGTSINLFQFLQEKIKENINLNEFIIIDINKQVKYFGNYFYMILSNILPKIIQKNQMDFINYEKLINKNFQNQNSNFDNIQNINHINYFNLYSNNNNNHINLYNNNCFSGINNIENNNDGVKNNTTNFKINDNSYNFLDFKNSNNVLNEKNSNNLNNPSTENKK